MHFNFKLALIFKLTSLVAQTVKRLLYSAMWETWVRSLGWEDPLEKEMGTHSSILAWRIPWQRSLVGCGARGCKELDITELLSHKVKKIFFSIIRFKVITFVPVK